MLGRHQSDDSPGMTHKDRRSGKFRMGEDLFNCHGVGMMELHDLDKAGVQIEQPLFQGPAGAAGADQPGFENAGSLPAAGDKGIPGRFEAGVDTQDGGRRGHAGEPVSFWTAFLAEL